MRHIDIDFQTFDYQRLTLGQREMLRRHAERRAKAERDEALRRMFACVGAGLRDPLGSIAGWLAALRLRFERRRSAAMLRALDDYTLKDIGVARCEIDSLALTAAGLRPSLARMNGVWGGANG
jgi:uncharacterized protein YjiS (DUF1127 family)